MNIEESGSSAFDNETCSARILRDQAVNVHVGETLRYFRILFYLFLLFFGASLNISVIILVSKFKRIRTLSFALALQIVTINLIIVFAVITSNIISNIANQWVFGKSLCVIIGALHYIAHMARIVLMLVFVIDRALAVFFSLSYPEHRRKIVCISSIIAWLLVIVLAIIMLPGVLDCYEFSPLRMGCYPSGDCNKNCESVLYVGDFLIVLPSIIASAVMYCSLFWKAKKAVNHDLIPANIPEGKVNPFKREWRATKTIFYMFVALIILTVPFYIWFFIHEIAAAASETPGWLFIFNVIIFNLITLLVMVDPIFIMRNRDVRDVLSEIPWIPKFLV